MSAATALHVGREVGFLAGGLGRAMLRVPLLFAILAWIAYAVFAGIAASMAADLHPVRETRVSCTLMPGEVAPGVGRNWATCQLGKGDVIMTNTYDLTRPYNTMALAAAYSFQAASVFTIGTLAVAVLSVFGGTKARTRRARKRHLANAVDHVQREHNRARRDVANTKARLGKVGERRAKQWGKRWSAEAAANEPYSNPGVVDRWLLRQAKPKKSRTAKKADKAAERIGKADKRRVETETDAEWAVELAAPATKPRLNPLDGPPLSPVQRDEYAGRVVDEAEATRRRLAAETADMFDRSAS